MQNKYVIFGAGNWGREAINEYGKDKVLYIVDNDTKMQGQEINDIPVVGFEHYINDERKPHVLIAIKEYADIQRQLDENGIQNYSFYVPPFKYYFSPDILVYNTYEHRNECKSETEYNESTINRKLFQWVESRVMRLKDNVPLFQHIEIETYNRCNGVCDFCPVSIKWESRPEKLMSKSLFTKIIDDLASFDYSGRLALFSNNEPFLDKRILEFHEYARKKLPNARMHLYTNGTLLTLDKFIVLMNYLDELIIDNYNQELDLIPNCKAIKKYCEQHPELIKRVTIVLRKPKEILATRGGDAPNRNDKVSYENTKCVNPFTQMIVRPDGKVSLCCNDPLGKNTMGDLNCNTLQEIWYGNQFQKVREALSRGRQYWSHCKYCDVFNID